MRSGTTGKDSSGFDLREMLCVKPTNLKVEDDARPDDSVPSFPQATDDALSDESWPPWDYVGINPACAKVDEDAVSKYSTLSLDDNGDKTPTIPKQAIFNNVLAAGDRGGAREAVDREILTQTQRHTPL